MAKNTKFDENYIHQLISNNLKRFRNLQNVSQLSLADMTGLTHNFIHDIENCKKGVSTKTLARLSNALNVEPYQFFLPDEIPGSEALVYVKDFNNSLQNFVNDLTQQYITGQRKDH
ncbi:MAG: helix-turn-helix domain-containing protein [Treponema sp.]|nr:helix-turn-helix domain-containing protein [Treponema sp.]MCL2236972.1 helix-turn-helix domain-containing protein [Treponema sp.]